MKFLFDLFPVILFFAAYTWTGDIYIATGVTIAATMGQVAYCWIRYRHVETMLWISLVLICVMGGMTLLLHNKQFIMWKPTILYWFFSAGLVGAWKFKQKNLIEKLMGSSIKLPRGIWTKLMYAWSLFFLALGALNIYVFHRFSEALWVKFKLFGVTGLLLAFAIAQSVFLSKYMQSEQEEQAAESEKP